MTKEKETYNAYFNIDPHYYAAVTKDLIDSGKVSWKHFYPHETFVKLLEKTHSVLSGKENASLWVEGAYGTGKSHAALTVKSLLEEPDKEVEAYFKDFGIKKDLRQKWLAVKNAGKLLTIHRIGSSSIRTDNELIFAVQDSIMRALEARGIKNCGQASLKDATLNWLAVKRNRDYFSDLIADEEYAFIFGSQSVEKIISLLEKGTSDEVTELMKNILEVAEKNGITAFRLDIQGLVEWIKDVISNNNLSGILFIWDEFTEFFQNNPYSLTGFQSLVEISQSHPFYFMIVSHESRSLFRNDATAKKILGRFVEPIKIELPENMAFRLMAQAMKTTEDEVLKKEWDECKAELNEQLIDARATICSCVKDSEKKSGALSDEELMGVVPIHPFAALLLKHLSVAFSSNQRSMFSFIISNDENSKAFKWFINKYGPLDSDNLLTVDMLWDFFYGNSQTGLNEEVRFVLDSYNLVDSSKLTLDELRVFKAVLLLEAITTRVKDVELLKPNERNVDLAFSGTYWPVGKARSIAVKLVEDGLLFERNVGGGKKEFTVANSTGDAETIRKKKEEVVKKTKTQDLVTFANLESAIELPPSIKDRFVIKAASAANFSQVLSKLEAQEETGRFRVLITFALNEDEAVQIREKISKAAGSNVIFIDASETPMGQELFEEYVENKAYSEYYFKSDKNRSEKYSAQSEKSLETWKSRIVTSGRFALYTKDRPNGELIQSLNDLKQELIKFDRQQYPCGLEQFNVIANMFAKNPLGQGAECGIIQKTTGTFRSSNKNTSLEKALEGAWGVEHYWEDSTKKSLPIVKIKLAVEKLVQEGFSGKTGRVGVYSIFKELQEKPFGFIANNLTAFVLGFVLKEYANENYFWTNGSTTEAMTVEKMKTMIANALKQELTPSNRFHEEFIVTMSENQRAFLKCSAKVFRIDSTRCDSVERARDQIRLAMKSLKFPIWCVKYTLSSEKLSTPVETIKETIDDFCGVANSANSGVGSESELASRIGKAALGNPKLVEDLVRLITSDNCQKGMLAYIGQFQGGRLKELADELDDSGAYLDEVKKKFNADDANWVWNPETADAKIADVILDYEIILESNKTLPKCVTLDDVVRRWNEKTNNIRLSFDAMKKAVGDLAGLLEILYFMKANSSLPEQKKKAFYNLLLTQRESFDQFYGNQAAVFKNVAGSLLGDLDDADINELFKTFSSGQFTKESQEYFTYVDSQISEYQKGQLKTKLRDLWHEKTGTQSPKDWSERYETPILCMFGDKERFDAKRVFETVSSSSPMEQDAQFALHYLKGATFYSRLADSEERDRCFLERIVGDYAVLLDDPNEVRKYLKNHSPEDVYSWTDNLVIQNLIKTHADKKYKTGGCSKAWDVVDEMDPDTLRKYVKDLITDNVRVGVEILRSKK